MLQLLKKKKNKTPLGKEGHEDNPSPVFENPGFSWLAGFKITQKMYKSKISLFAHCTSRIQRGLLKES